MKFIVGLFIVASLYAKDSTQSTVFKSPFKFSNAMSVVRPSEVTYQLWEGFSLVRKANSGDADALHELGIRYLTGQGFSADSVKAFELIHRAAENGHLLALFNLGVFYHNGWGTEWNPFQAYKYFRSGAEKGTREAQFAYAIYYTDNLTVPRDLNKAYIWMNKSVVNGYTPAKDLLPEIERYRDLNIRDSVIMLTTPQAVSVQTLLEPVAFNDMIEIEEKIETTFSLVKVLSSLDKQWEKRITKIQPINDSILFLQLVKHAEWGVPEEFTIIGRCYENGIGVGLDSAKALLAYLRAVRLESRRAPQLLIRLLENESLIRKIQEKANRGDAESQYIIACFALTDIFPTQKQEDIILFLQRSAMESFVPSITELGAVYFSGQIVPQDQRKALDLWKRSTLLGSHESLVRISAARILAGFGDMSLDSARGIVITANEEGSMAAQMAMAFSHERGIGTPIKPSEAVKLYRLALQRGSRTAFLSLQRMYDRIRPSGDEEFRITHQNE